MAGSSRHVANVSKDGRKSDPVDHSSATQNATPDPDLDVVVEAWGRLPDAVRGAILTMVRATAGGKG